MNIFTRILDLWINEKQPLACNSSPIDLEDEVESISCFIKGVIKSMEENPEDWKQNYVNGRNFSYSYRELIVNFKNFCYVSINCWDLNNTERKLLTESVQKLYDYNNFKFQQLMKEKEIIREKENSQKRIYFEKLGYPEIKF